MPNRIAVGGARVAGIAAALASLLGAVDSIEKAIVLSVALLAVAAVVIVYLFGWQKHEARTFKAETGIADVSVNVEGDGAASA